MYRIVLGLSLNVVALLSALSPLHGQDQPKKQTLEGIWMGPIKAGAKDVRMAFIVTAKDGKLVATMDSVDQGAKGIPVAEVVFKDGVVKFDIAIAKVVFEGKLNKEATEIVGEWKQGGAGFPMTLKRVDELPVVSRPQDPKRPYPYREEEVVYENKKDNVKLAGTLTLPKSGGPFPAVLLITGSGPQNRDSEIKGHKTFLVIADYLTRRGIAVLRVDDRGVGGSTGKIDTSTTADFAGDVLTGIDFLKAHKEIDAKRIGLIGHSEGGIIAPMVAAQSKDVAFIVMLAGTGLPGGDILMLQTKLIMKSLGAPQEEIDVHTKLQAMVYGVINKETDLEVAKKLIVEKFADMKAKASPEDKKRLEMRETTDLKFMLKDLDSKWLRYFISNDPRPSLRKVQCPVLALNGSKDQQVPPTENLTEIAKALKEGGNKDVTTKEMADLNHLFQTCKTGSIVEYGLIDETIAPAVLEMMGEWILGRVKK